MPSWKSPIKLSAKALPLWLLGATFIVAGLVIGEPGLKMAQADLSWANATTTTGRVIITEWKKERDENRLVVVYGYQNERGVIFHNTAVLARKLGKINLNPGTPVVVKYSVGNPEQSRMQMELGAREWIPLLAMAAIEVAAGLIFLVAAFKKQFARPVAVIESAIPEPEEIASL